MQITTRPANETDTEFARALHHRAYHDVVVRQFGSWDDELQDGFFNQTWDPANFGVISIDDTPCGVLRVEGTDSKLYIHEIMISPEYQGKGIGSALLQQIQNEARQDNVAVGLQVLHENQAAELYTRLGFEPISTTDTHTLMEWRP